MTEKQRVPGGPAGPSPDSRKDLRRRAEEIARAQPHRLPESAAALTAMETRRLLHDLCVRHIELDMQNEKLRRAESELSRWASFPERSPDPVVESDMDGQLRYLNPAARQLLPELERKGVQHPWLADWPAVTHAVRQGPFTRELRIDERHFQQTMHYLAKDGRIRIYGTDITGRVHAEAERTAAKAELRQSQKMEVVGRLAGGVAHDFNNILIVILGNCNFLLNSIPKDDPRHTDVEDIRKAGERAADLTRQLLAFSRNQVLQLRALDLNASMTSMEKLLRRLIGEDVNLTVSGAKDLALVKADPGQMEQIIMNLAVNSRDAMPKGGRLVIETSNMKLAGDQLGTQGFIMPPGSYVLLTVSDTGIGMDEGTLEHIFEPFFTTKELGKGTGLGLATVYGVIKQSNGFIDVQSKPGQGTTFRIFLPTAPAAMPGEGEREGEGETKRPVKKKRHTILLVEDEETVRRIACRILKSAGYGVLEAKSGQAALAHADKNFDLVVTDIVMPDMSGVDLAAEITKGKPALGTVYMSGYTDNEDIRAVLSRPEHRFLQKPFTAEGLLAKVREALE